MSELSDVEIFPEVQVQARGRLRMRAARDSSESSSGSASRSASRSRSRSRSPPRAASRTGSGSERDESWSTEDDNERFRRLFVPEEPPEGPAPLSTVCPRWAGGVQPSAFRRPAALGLPQRDLHSSRTVWTDFVELKLEAKRLPCSRLAVEVYDGTLPLPLEALVDERNKYQTRPRDMTDFRLVQRSKAVLRTAHEAVNLFKKVRGQFFLLSFLSESFLVVSRVPSLWGAHVVCLGLPHHCAALF